MQKRSLTATRHAAERAVDGRRRLVGDPREGVQLVGRGARAVGLEQLGRVELAALRRRRGLRRGQVEDRRVASCRLRARDEEAAVLRGGSLGQRDVAIEARARLVGPQRLLDLDDVARRRHVVQRELR